VIQYLTSSTKTPIQSYRSTLSVNLFNSRQVSLPPATLFTSKNAVSGLQKIIVTATSVSYKPPEDHTLVRLALEITRSYSMAPTASFSVTKIV